MIPKGLSRILAEIYRPLEDGASVLECSAVCTVRHAGGGLARSPDGEFVRCEAIAYFPSDTKISAKHWLRVHDGEYAIVFVERGAHTRAPVRVGLKTKE